MSKVLMLNHSDSGNTANMVQYVAEGVHSVENTKLYAIQNLS
jgi:flavorubredoxin